MPRQKQGINPQDETLSWPEPMKKLLRLSLKKLKLRHKDPSAEWPTCKAMAERPLTQAPTFRGPVVQDSLLDRQDLQGCQGSPAEAGSGVQGHGDMLQQNIHNEHCLLGSQTVNEQSGAVEAVMEFADRRHQYYKF